MARNVLFVQHPVVMGNLLSVIYDLATNCQRLSLDKLIVRLLDFDNLM